MYVIIVAAGSGTRMKSDIPKQFLLLNHKPIISYAIERFLSYSESIKIILVIASGYEKYTNDIIKNYFKADISLVYGGENRYESVKNGLVLIPNDEIVFVHDGVRPFFSLNLLENLKKITIEKGNAIPCLPIKETTRIIERNSNSYIDRSKLVTVQTPQTFNSSMLKRAFEQPYSTAFTDDATIVETLGEKINLITGEEYNLKITTPFDLQFAEMLLSTNLV